MCVSASLRLLFVRDGVDDGTEETATEEEDEDDDDDDDKEDEEDDKEETDEAADTEDDAAAVDEEADDDDEEEEDEEDDPDDVDDEAEDDDEDDDEEEEATEDEEEEEEEASGMTSRVGFARLDARVARLGVVRAALVFAATSSPSFCSAFSSCLLNRVLLLRPRVRSSFFSSSGAGSVDASTATFSFAVDLRFLVPFFFDSELFASSFSSLVSSFSAFADLSSVCCCCSCCSCCCFSFSSCCCCCCCCCCCFSFNFLSRSSAARFSASRRARCFSLFSFLRRVRSLCLEGDMEGDEDEDDEADDDEDNNVVAGKDEDEDEDDEDEAADDEAAERETGDCDG